MEGLLRVSVVATGIEAESVAMPRLLPSGLSTLKPKPTRSKRQPLKRRRLLFDRLLKSKRRRPSRAAEAELSCSMRVLSRKRSCWKKSRNQRPKSRSWQRLNRPLRHLKEEPHLEPQTARREPFIPKRPLRPKITARKMAPGAFEAAAMENGTSEAPKRDIVQVFLKG